MRRYLLVLVVSGLCVVFAQAQNAEVAPVTDAEVASVVAANNAFAVDLYRTMAKEPGNLCFSPYNIHKVMSMTLTGTAGNTYTELQKALHVTLPADRYNVTYKELRNVLGKGNDNRKVLVAQATGIWVAPDFQLDQGYAQRIQDSFNGDTKVLPKNQADAAAAINRWVTEATREQIKEVATEESNQAGAEMVISGAIYYRALWQSQFKVANTRRGAFYQAPDSTLRVFLMYQEMNVRYMENDLIQMVELPYAGRRQSMLVILPKTRGNLAAVEETFDVETLDAWMKQMKDVPVKVWLPRFELEGKAALVDHFKAKGVSDLFAQGSANLSPMGSSPNGELYVGKINHFAKVTVDEAGVVAAAYTEVQVYGFGDFEPEKVDQFVADQPFIFILRDLNAGAILFMGRVHQPTRVVE